MKTNKKTSNKSLLNVKILTTLDKNEQKEICGGGLIIEYYIENGEIKQRIIYTDD